MKLLEFEAVCLLLCASMVACQSQDWDYLVYTEEWPGTFCLYKYCNFPSSTVKGWNIHGLWPSNSDGSDPFYCPGAPSFNIDNLNSIYPTLQVKWADLLSFNSPSEFWKHEWDKHGTCAIQDSVMPNELAYFSAGLYLKGKAGFQQSLEAAGIVPSDSYQYTETMVQDAIFKSLQITPILRCIRYQGQLYLSEIEVCADRSLGLADCDKYRGSDIVAARELMRNAFQNAKLSLTGTYSTSPVNEPCQDRPFLIPVISTS